MNEQIIEDRELLKRSDSKKNDDFRLFRFDIRTFDLVFIFHFLARYANWEVFLLSSSYPAESLWKSWFFKKLGLRMKNAYIQSLNNPPPISYVVKMSF